MDTNIPKVEAKVQEALVIPLFLWPKLANTLPPAEVEAFIEQLLVISDRAERLALFLAAFSRYCPEKKLQNLTPPQVNSDAIWIEPCSGVEVADA